VDVPRFEAVGVAALERAVRDADLIIVDEIGKMELCSPRSSSDGVGAPLAEASPGHSLAGASSVDRRAQAAPGVELYRLSERNRDDLKGALLTRLRNAIGA